MVGFGRKLKHRRGTWADGCICISIDCIVSTCVEGVIIDEYVAIAGDAKIEAFAM